MQTVKYDMVDARTSFEFILEQVICGTEVVIVRYGVEVARITALQARQALEPVALLQAYEVAHAS